MHATTDAMLTAAALERAAARVPLRLQELAEIGATPDGGITRLPFSPEEAAAVALFGRWATEAGGRVVTDEFGNVFALRGDWDRDSGLMLGSHLDSVVNGGRYDGALGVVGALAVLEAWEHDAPICVAAFRAEEATQAGRGRVGSSVFAGLLSTEQAFNLFADRRNDRLPRLDVVDLRRPRIYLELHVEQGPRLEETGATVGAVTGITGYVRWQAELSGRADHVGAAPMESRRDPLAAAAEIILEVERLGREQVDVASVGFLGVRPNRIGVIAADTQLTADIRDWDEKAIETAIAVLKTAAEASCRRRSVALSARVVTRATTTRFPEEIIAAVVAAAATVGHAAVRLPSAANHDASNLAAICPAGMVFVPSRGGRSHSPEEFTTPDACVVGTTVLGLTAHSLMTAAQSSEPSASEPGP